MKIKTINGDIIEVKVSFPRNDQILISVKEQGQVLGYGLVTDVSTRYKKASPVHIPVRHIDTSHRHRIQGGECVDCHLVIENEEADKD